MEPNNIVAGTNTVTWETTAASTGAGVLDFGTNGYISVVDGGIMSINNQWITGNVIFSGKRKTFFGRKNTDYPDVQARDFFRIIKKGLTKTEKKLYQKLAEEAFEQAAEHLQLGQKNVAEQFEKIFRLNIKKAAIDLADYDTIINLKMIEKYRDHLPSKKELVIDDLSEYDKPLPKHVQVKLSRAKQEKVFDSFSVFWIREVIDPILFGQIEEEPEVYYFIDEWDDDISVKD